MCGGLTFGDGGVDGLCGFSCGGDVYNIISFGDGGNEEFAVGFGGSCSTATVCEWKHFNFCAFKGCIIGGDDACEFGIGSFLVDAAFEDCDGEIVYFIGASGFEDAFSGIANVYYFGPESIDFAIVGYYFVVSFVDFVVLGDVVVF